MKKLIALLFLAVSLGYSQAQTLMTTTVLAANTSSNILAAGAIIDNLTIINATTNTATLKFYDTSNTTTTMVRAANITFSTISTNFDVVFTNATGVLVTNTFSGVYTAPTTNSAVTNSRPVLITLAVPAGTVLNKDVKIQVLRGLAVVPNQDTTCVTTYRLPY